MKTEEIKIIGEIDFHDVKVNVYYHPDNKNGNPGCAWQMRNPDSCYQGIMFIDNKTGKCTYPEDAIIPEQTDKDREMLPKFIITGEKELNDELISSIKKYLDSSYIRRNKTKFKK